MLSKDPGNVHEDSRKRIQEDSLFRSLLMFFAKITELMTSALWMKAMPKTKLISFRLAFSSLYRN